MNAELLIPAALRDLDVSQQQLPDKYSIFPLSDSGTQYYLLQLDISRVMNTLGSKSQGCDTRTTFQKGFDTV